MKRKALIVCALLALAAGVQAQYGADYYHRTGDTVYTYSDIAFYNWWDFERMLRLRESITVGIDISGYPDYPLMITPYFTATPIRVVGIAGCPAINRRNDGTLPPLPEYFYLFDAGSEEVEGPVYLDRVEIPFRDSTSHRYIHFDINYPSYTIWDSCCNDELREVVYDLYECYFDSVITVTDSFYVGWSLNNRSKHCGTVEYATAMLGMRGFLAESCYEFDTFPALPGSTNCFFPYIDYYVCNDTAINTNPAGSYTWTPWRRGNKASRQFVLVYPLIEIDTTVPPAFLCEPVQNLQATVLDTGSGCVFFSWDDFLHYTYCELQYYAPQNGIASAIDTIVSGANILHLCGLDTMLAYYVRARAFCDTSKIETGWSNWVPFSFPHTDPPTPPEPPQGIAEPSVLDRFTHLLPNPAADKVTVMSELGMLHIDIYNARGILVYSEPVGYSSATIDLRGWPAGQYMMSIETRRGKTTKRLVVAR